MKYERIPYFRFIPIILISAILFRVVYSIENIAGILGFLLSLLSYFFWGFIIAYLLNPLMVYIERKAKVKRALALLIVYVLFIGIISLVCVIIVPIVVSNIINLIASMPDYIINIQNWIAHFTLTNKHLTNQFLKTYNIPDNVNRVLNNYLKNMNIYLGIGLQLLVQNLINLSSILIKFTTGIVISIYLLRDKENFILNLKKLFIVILGGKKTSIVISFGEKVNIIFKRFVIGKFIDSIIIGSICFFSLLVLKIPYAIIISIIIGCTNMIPYFGNVIGMVPACLISLFASPLKSLEVGLVILFLMQFDGLFLAPKIIGEKIGLNPIWIILGITIGGGIYGIVGMFLGVPIVAVVKLLLQEFMNRKLKDNNSTL